MATIKQCEECKRFYNASEYPECPYCAETKAHAPMSRSGKAGIFGKIRKTSKPKGMTTTEEVAPESMKKLEEKETDAVDKNTAGEFGETIPLDEQQGNIGKTVPLNQSIPNADGGMVSPKTDEDEAVEGLGKTVPLKRNVEEPEIETLGKTVPLKMAKEEAVEELGRTVPLRREEIASEEHPESKVQPEQNNKDDADVNGPVRLVLRRKNSSNSEEKTPDIPEQPVISDTKRTVGWISCIKGVYKGQSFALHQGKNKIGRSANMDIDLNEDNDIAEGSAVMIIFNVEKGLFFIAEGESDDYSYLNGEEIMGRQKLEAYDRIELCGRNRNLFTFVPLCGEHFSYSEYEEE